MEKIVYECDRCGKELHIGESWFSAEWDGGRLDFCGDCQNKAIEALKIITLQPSEEEPKKVIPKAPTGGDRRSLKLDLGKIAALHAAGWSNAKIAQEMGCSPQSIGNYLPKAIEFYSKQQEALAHAEEDRD